MERLIVWCQLFSTFRLLLQAATVQSYSEQIPNAELIRPVILSHQSERSPLRRCNIRIWLPSNVDEIILCLNRSRSHVKMKLHGQSKNPTKGSSTFEGYSEQQGWHAHLGLSGGIRGYIDAVDYLLIIEPAEHTARSNLTDLHNLTRVKYESGARDFTAPFFEEQLKAKIRQKRSMKKGNKKPVLYVEMLMMIGPSVVEIYEYDYELVHEHAVISASLLQRVYTQKPISDVASINIFLTGMLAFKSLPPGLFELGNASLFLYNLAEWSNKNLADHISYDIACWLFNVPPNIGYSFTSQLCKSYRYFAAPSFGLATGIGMAHEFGHSMGIGDNYNPSESPCFDYEETEFVMGRLWRNRKSAVWSSCDAKDLRKYINYEYLNPLYPWPRCADIPPSYNPDYFAYKTTEMVDRETYCIRNHGPTSVPCHNDPNEAPEPTLICQITKCIPNSTTDACEDTRMIAYDGTRCEAPGESPKYCTRYGLCAEHRDRLRNGGWSVWSLPDHCRNGVARVHRLCNNPPPEFGGKLCKGVEVEKVKCSNLTELETSYVSLPQIFGYSTGVSRLFPSRPSIFILVNLITHAIVIRLALP